MAKIIFDKYHCNVDMPTLLLQNRDFDTIGIFSNISNFTYSENFNSSNEVSFTTYYKNGYGQINPLWNSICDLKVIYIPEFNERSVSDTKHTVMKRSACCDILYQNIHFLFILCSLSRQLSGNVSDQGRYASSNSGWFR